MSIIRRIHLGSWLFGLVIVLATVAPAVWAADDDETRPAAIAANRITLDFDNLHDLDWVTNQYSHLGLSFNGATVLGQGGSLNYLGFPPHSGLNVLYDDPVESGRITVTFDQAIAANVTAVGAYVTGNRNVSMTAYDAGGISLGSTETGGDNHAPVGTPNKLLQLSTAQPIKTVVFFNGGERGNTFTVDDFYFEGGQACTIPGVPLYKQDGSAPWADDLYGGSPAKPWIDPNTGRNATIRNWGCAMTSSAMIVSYYAQLQGKQGTDPRELNTWLRANGGYTGGSIYWGKVAEFARKVKGINLYFYEGTGPDNGIINAYLCNGAPIILYTTSSPYRSHYVLATGVADGVSWAVNDPAGHNLTTMSASPPRTYRKYGSEAKEPHSLTMAIHPPNTPQALREGLVAAVSIVITDPAGRTLTYDATTGTFENQILDANFGVEELSAEDGSGQPITTFVFGTGAPLEGEYQVQIIPHVSGVYELDLLAYDAADTSSAAASSGYAPADSPIDLSIGYSPDPGSEVEVTPEWPAAGDLYLPAVIAN
jgi:hypothetical protein